MRAPRMLNELHGAEVHGRLEKALLRHGIRPANDVLRGLARMKVAADPEGHEYVARLVAALGRVSG